MLDGYSVNATAAKIRTSYGTMFTAENYHELMNRQSVPDAAEYLAHTARFKDAFKEVDPNTIHRGYLEELLYRENFRTYMRLCRFQGLDKKPFYDFLIRKREVEIILSVINNINSSLDGSYLRDLPGYLIKHFSIRIMQVSTATTYEELLKALRGTKYYKILVKIPPRDDGSADYTECELRLRSDYFANVLEQADKSFSKAVSDELKEMILREIDSRNIINAYRMKAFFGYSAEEIKRRSLKFSAIGMKRMERFYECRDADQMLEMLSRTAYGRNSVQTDNIEVKINSVKIKYLRDKLVCGISAPVNLYAFVQLCDIDVANIVHIIEGIRYGADRSLIESQLVTL